MLGLARNNSQKSQSAAQSLAFWGGLLTTLLVIPQIWQVSQWIANRVFGPQFGYEIAYYLSFLVCVLLCGLSISLNKLFWGTSVGLLVVFVLSKLPII